MTAAANTFLADVESHLANIAADAPPDFTSINKVLNDAAAIVADMKKVHDLFVNGNLIAVPHVPPPIEGGPPNPLNPLLLPLLDAVEGFLSKLKVNATDDPIVSEIKEFCVVAAPIFTTGVRYMLSTYADSVQDAPGVPTQDAPPVVQPAE